MDMQIGRPTGQHTQTILVVENHPTALAQRLGHLGYMVVSSDDDTHALRLVAAGGFDLILLGTDSLSMLRDIRAAPDGGDVPILMFTERGDAMGAVAAMVGGASDYQPRPFALDVLAARIARLLTQRRNQCRQLKYAAIADPITTHMTTTPLNAQGCSA